MREIPSRPSESYDLVRALFLRVLGIVVFCAFVSVWTQLDGLIGSHGISPAQELLALARGQLAAQAYWRLPTLLWLAPSDSTLHLLCALGAGLGLALAAGAPRPAATLALVWMLYLSLMSVGDVFLGYQWDALLLETCFFSVGLAAWCHPPSRVALWLLRWLLFRLVFLSGMVKLLSGDPAWRDLTALTYHYWTQPLPTWTSFYANALLPPWQVFSCGLTLAIELGAPLGIFGPRCVRLVSCAAIVLLQLMIALTGNYGFFNLLCLCLCLLLLDDRALRGLRPLFRRVPLAQSAAGPEGARRRPLTRGVAAALAAGLFLLTAGEALERLDAGALVPSAVEQLLALLSPLRTFNSYGLFAVMTKERREIQIEGSSDGTRWQPYEFRWKPGRLDRRPRFATPHMPRLDWQMWFAALGSCERELWFHTFLARLLEGEPAVIALLAENPFPEAPPRYLRSTLWRYRFPSAEERHQGVWWSREEVGPYCPPVTLVEGRLRVAGEELP